MKFLLEINKEETEKLKEFIVTENEKLVEAKNSFKEDRDKFQKYVEQLAFEAEKAKQETEKLVDLKQKKNKHINRLKEELAEVNREISKVDDELKVAKDHKDFIMDLSMLMSAAVKKGKQKRTTKVSDSDTDFFITNKEQSDKP